MRIQAPWSDLLAEPLAREHFVQLYRDDAVLTEAVSLFLGVGFGKQESAVVVATPKHLSAFEERLVSRGFDVEDLKRWGQLTVLDASATLSRFMVDGLPDAPLFKEAATEVLTRARAAGRYRHVRVYGEMVNLLWRDNLPAAVRLEILWNELVEQNPITLFCAYGLNDDPASSFDRTLRVLHGHLIPVEACS